MKQMSLIGVIISSKRGGKLQRADYTTLQKERLMKLVAYARKHSPYYDRLRM